MLLSVAGPAGEAERLEAVTRELLERLNMQVELRSVPRISVAEMSRPLTPGRQYFARVWIAFGARGARLYLEHGPSDRVLVREVADDTNNSELVREELGHILQTAVEGLRAGEELGLPRGAVLKELAAQEEPLAVVPSERPPAQVDGHVPSPSLREHARLRFSPRYEVRWLGDGPRLEDGPGAAFEAALPIGFELSGYYRRPVRVEDASIGVRLQTLSLRALISIQAWRAERSRIRLSAGAGADFVRVTPVAASGGSAELLDGGWLKLAAGRLEASYGYRVVSFMELRVALGLDLDLSDTRYVIQRASGERVVFDPWPVRPVLSLGAAVP